MVTGGLTGGLTGGPVMTGGLTGGPVVTGHVLTGPVTGGPVTGDRLTGGPVICYGVVNSAIGGLLLCHELGTGCETVLGTPFALVNGSHAFGWSSANATVPQTTGYTKHSHDLQHTGPGL